MNLSHNGASRSRVPLQIAAPNKYSGLWIALALFFYSWKNRDDKNEAVCPRQKLVSEVGSSRTLTGAVRAFGAAGRRTPTRGRSQARRVAALIQKV